MTVIDCAGELLNVISSTDTSCDCHYYRSNIGLSHKKPSDECHR